jgi:hypothetical protein
LLSVLDYDIGCGLAMANEFGSKKFSDSIKISYVKGFSKTIEE